MKLHSGNKPFQCTVSLKHFCHISTKMFQMFMALECYEKECIAWNKDIICDCGGTPLPVLMAKVFLHTLEINQETVGLCEFRRDQERNDD